MSLAAPRGDREKFDFLLQLSLEQVRALEADDMDGFDQILAAKDAVITSFQDARTLAAADSTLNTVILQIQEADKAAQHLLYRKTGRIMRQLTEIGQQKRAHSAYQVPEGRHAETISNDASSFVDRKR